MNTTSLYLLTKTAKNNSSTSIFTPRTVITD